MLTLGVIADTHIPDRTKHLNPEALEVFKRADVDAILHAGDMCLPKVISQLKEIAPVHTVRGNRDLFGFRDIPWNQQLEFEGVTIGITHGHGGWWEYVLERLSYTYKGSPKFSHFENKAIHSFPDVDVLVLGHNHAPANRWQDGQLIFNPGSPCCPNDNYPNLPPSVGLLHIDRGNVEGEIVFL